MRFDRVVDLPSWIRSHSTGAVAVPDFSSRELDQAATDLVERYQFGDLSPDLAAVREGQVESADAAALRRFVDGYRDLVGYTVYRGLWLGDTAPETGAFHREAAVSGWTVYPSIAWRTALAQGAGGIAILRDRIGEDDPAFFVDIWEFEVLRPPQTRRIGSIFMEAMEVATELVYVYVVDLEID